MVGRSADVLAESDPRWGVYRLKQGFGGEFTPCISAWAFPTNRSAYLGAAPSPCRRY